MLIAAFVVSAVGTVASLALRLLNADPTLTFGVAALTILALAYLLGHATEQLGISAGPRIGGIMNATVGNIGEIIIAAFLILDGKIEVVTRRSPARSSATCCSCSARRCSSAA